MRNTRLLLATYIELGFHTTQISTLCTEGAVFSSCTVLESGSTLDVVCGSHDNHMHCWNHKYNLNWKTRLDSPVYSTPCPVNLTGNSRCNESETVQALCVCSSAGGLYIVDERTGFILGSYRFPSSVFSSPVCYGNSIVVGCRDNFVYCLDWSFVP